MNANLGSFFFRYRNGIGPVVFLVAILLGTPTYPFGRSDLNLTLDIVGIFVAMLGQILRIITIGYEYIERGGRNRQVYASKLVQGGVFAHCRNPLYVGNILLAVGISLVVHSQLFYLSVLPLVALVYISIVSEEERFLLNKFGKEYIQYCSRVNRWIPQWKGWTRSIADMEFNWRRVLVKEYNTMFVLLLALGIVKIWSDYQVEGDTSLPTIRSLWIAFLVWLGAYIVVRSMKKSGFIKP